jgi:hypothetical protein
MRALNRREFAESVMTAALVPLLGTGVAPLPSGWWQGASSAAGTPPSLDGDLDTVAQSLAGVIRAQYGDRLGDADIAAITRQIRSALERAEQMRKVDLANADEPDSVFSAPGDAPR